MARPERTNRYDAFISYSRAADGDLAPELQTGLQRLAKPWSKRRALEVFRDETGLAVTPDLWASITDALDDARWFVLLASPQAAESRWVNQEIERWLDNDPDGAHRILPVLTSGSMVWNRETGDWSDDSDAVPPALRGVYEREPRYIDLSWVDDSTRLDLDEPRFRQAVAEIAAPMHGLSQDDLIGEDVRRHRVATRLRRGAIAALVVLTVGAIVAALIALDAEDRAQRSAAEATTREYAALSASFLEDDPEIATLYAVEAVVGPDGTPDDPTRRPEAERALRNALGQLLSVDTHPVGIPIDTTAAAIAVSPDGSHLATIDADGVITVWVVESGTPLDDGPLATVPPPGDLFDPFGPGLELSYSPDGTRLLLGWNRVEFEAPAPVVVEVATGGSSTIDAVGLAAWLPDGSVAAVGPGRDSVIRWSSADDPVDTIATVDVPAPTDSDPAPGIDAVTVTAAGQVAIWTPDDRLLVVDPDRPGAGPVFVRDLADLEQAASRIVWAADPAEEAIHLFLRTQPEESEGNRPSFWLGRIATTDAPGRWPTQAEPVAAGTLSVSPDGAFVATVDGEYQQGLSGAQSGVTETGRFVQITSVASDTDVGTQITVPTNGATDVAWLPDGRVLAIASRNGVAFRRVDLDPFSHGAAGIAVSGDGRRVATWYDVKSRVEVHEVEANGPIMVFAAGSIEGDGDDPEPETGVIAFGPGADSVLYTGLTRTSEADTADLLDAVLTEADIPRNTPVATSSDGRRSVDGTGRVVVLSTGAVERRLELGATPFDLRWAADDTEVIELDADGGLTAHDVATGAATPIADGLRSVASFDVSADGETIVVGDARGRLFLIDRSAGEVAATIRAHRGAVTSVDIRGATVASAGDSIALHSLDTRQELWSSDDVPALADTDWWLVARTTDSLFAASRFRVVELHGPDLALACASVDPATIARFRTTTGTGSSCIAINRSDDARPLRADPPADAAPLVTTPSTRLVIPSPEEFAAGLDTGQPSDPLLDEALGVISGPLPDEASIRAVCQSFQDRTELPLQIGDRGRLVAAVQALITRSAGDPFSDDLPVVDGCLGSHTTRYVQLFQVREGLEPTGVVDQATWDLLVAG